MARWLDQGLTSRTHPVIQHALKTLIEPSGLRCNYVEIEPFGIIEVGVGGLLFSCPRFDTKGATTPVIRALVTRYPSIRTESAGSGHTFFSAPAVTGEVSTLMADMAQLYYDTAAAVVEARRFVLMAAIILAEEGTPEAIKQAYLADDFVTFYAFVNRRIEEQATP